MATIDQLYYHSSLTDEKAETNVSMHVFPWVTYEINT